MNSKKSWKKVHALSNQAMATPGGEGEMLLRKVQFDHAHMQMRPFFPTAALAVIGREGIDHDAVGLAGAAVGALRAVDIQTAAAKAQINQLAVIAVTISCFAT